MPNIVFRHINIMFFSIENKFIVYHSLMFNEILK